MKTNVLLITACATMMACSNNTTVPNRVELPGIVDNEAFAANVESISVMNLQMDDDWTISDCDDLKVGFTDNYIYLLDDPMNFRDPRLCLMCFDRATGEKLSVRNIKGRGPGELDNITSMFCLGDTLYIYDSGNRVLSYDNDCKFLGIKHQFGVLGLRPKLIGLSSGNYVMLWLVSQPSDTKHIALILTDRNFDTISTHFATPDPNFYLYAAEAEPYYANDDTIRFIFPNDNHLYSLCGDKEQCIELGYQNPMTPEIAMQTMNDEKRYEYNNYNGGLSESGRFIFLKFGSGFGNGYYVSMFDKHTYKAVSILMEEKEEEKQTADLVNSIVLQSFVAETDGKFIYAFCPNSAMAAILEGHDNLLDDRLKKTQAEYRAYLERNAEYINGLEPEERDAATVLLKIKLKD